jgi:hypothetical protein
MEEGIYEISGVDLNKPGVPRYIAVFRVNGQNGSKEETGVCLIERACNKFFYPFSRDGFSIPMAIQDYCEKHFFGDCYLEGRTSLIRLGGLELLS